MSNNIILEAQLELIDEPSVDEAFASVSLNPTFQWAKIVVTDDQPNANKHRVPQDEFDNIISTGIFAPIKMDYSQISSGHSDAMGKPIGLITQLTKANNRVIALAALWKRERPEDIEALKKMYVDGNPPNVSWELSYAESSIENEIETLKGVSLNGLAIVSLPAYEGRTQFIAMASKDGDSSKEETIVNEDELKQKISELETELASLKEQLTARDTELASLKDYKNTIEAEKAKVERLAVIKQKFQEAKLEKDEAYFNEKADTLLKLDDASLDFMIQEMTAFQAAASVSDSEDKIPDFKKKSASQLSPRELGRLLRERSKETK